MGQVTVQLNGRNYRLSCGDGEEARLLDLADHIRQRIDDLSYEFKNSGDERLLLMAAIMITDELWDARARIAGLEAAAGGAAPDLALSETVVVETVEAAATAAKLPDAPAEEPAVQAAPVAAAVAPAEPNVHEPSLKRALRRQQPAAKGSFTDRLAVAQGTKGGS